MPDYAAKHSYIIINEECNHNCVFCSNHGEHRLFSDLLIRKTLTPAPKQVNIEGGEPLLSGKLLKWLRLSKQNGAEQLVLLTNGSLLHDKRLLAPVLRAGVDIFNVNLPSHDEKLHDLMTGTTGFFRKKIAGIKQLLAQKRKVVLTFVITTLNYPSLEKYVVFVKKELRGVFYINFVFVQVRGAVSSGIVPDMNLVSPHIRSALLLAREAGLNCIVDDIPFCVIRGAEKYSLDAQRRAAGGQGGQANIHGAPCRRCRLLSLCSGPRRDYVGIHGWKAFSPYKNKREGSA